MMHPRTFLAVGTLAVVVLTVAARSQTAQPSNEAAAGRWFKGNTHTHTVNSDGDSTPDEVVRWYREHGYQFLVLTDHNYLTNVDGLNAVHGASDKFLVIQGEEVTSTAATKPVHVNGLAIEALVPPPKASTVGEALQQSVDGIRAVKGVPHVNHPNFRWALTADDLRQLERTTLFEIFNGHPQVNNEGGGGVPGLEEVWDRLLSSGRLMYGIAVDDAHHFKRPGDPAASGPGRGWVVVRAARLEPRAIVEALERGDFYASTGVELEAYEATASAITLKVRATAWSKYRVQFIGRGGRVLVEQADSSASYTFKGDEGYVRAKIIESNGQLGWTQPVPVGASGPK
ncbi:MAG: CehA/McbA family metallohydrolase [Vicinamibacterales bacterium]